MSTISALLLVACLCQALISAGFMPKERARISGSAESEKTFLQNYVGPESTCDAEKTRYFYRFVALSDGQKEVVIYLTGQSWCGSGGCTTLILAPEGSSLRVVGKIPITRCQSASYQARPISGMA